AGPERHGRRAALPPRRAARRRSRRPRPADRRHHWPRAPHAARALPARRSRHRRHRRRRHRRLGRRHRRGVLRIRHHRRGTDRAGAPVERSRRPDRSPAESRAPRTVVKATQRDFAGIAPRAARAARVAFFCGPDEAGAAAAAARLAALLPDPGERIELSGGELRSDPVRLGDEARSTSLFGGTRHIYVRAAGDEAHDAVRTYLEVIDAGEGEGACPVLIVATSATDKSRTAKLLESRADGLVAM